MRPNLGEDEVEVDEDRDEDGGRQSPEGHLVRVLPPQDQRSENPEEQRAPGGRQYGRHDPRRHDGDHSLEREGVDGVVPLSPDDGILAIPDQGEGNNSADCSAMRFGLVRAAELQCNAILRYEKKFFRNDVVL